MPKEARKSWLNVNSFLGKQCFFLNFDYTLNLVLAWVLFETIFSLFKTIGLNVRGRIVPDNG